MYKIYFDVKKRVFNIKFSFTFMDISQAEATVHDGP